MNPRNTWRWIIVAAVLGGAIFLHKKFSTKPPTGPIRVLPGLKAADIDSVQVLPKGRPAIHVERATNGVWALTDPVYPAQSGSIEYLLAALQQLAAARYLPVEELKKMTNADAQFGFDPPQASLMLGQRNYHVLIGDKTPTGDQVYVQVVAAGGVYVVDADLLTLIPQTADQWRETALADWRQLRFDRVVVTNAGKILELQLNPTNKLWRMVLPLPTRADSRLVEESLQRLQSLRAQRFDSDVPKPDLDSFGLQNPELTLAFFQGTNTALLLHFGKSPTTNSAELVYARRDDQNAIVTVSRDAFQPWLAASSHEFRDFLDHHLISPTRLPDTIEIRAQDNFTLQRQTNDTWQVLPWNFPADLVLMQEFITRLVNLKFTEIEKEVVLDRDLPAYELKPPTRQYIFQIADPNAVDGATNQVAAQLDVGLHDKKVYARTKGEDFVYAINPEDPNFKLLPTASWQLHDRRIWNFSETNVARITIRQNGKTREILHYGPNSWALAAGSVGSIESFPIEEAAHQLGGLQASSWIARGDQDRARYGFTPEGHQVTVELKDGRKLSVEFGNIMPSACPYAIALVENEPWIFEFPLAVYWKNVKYLTIPSDIP